jgi:hypothetical protein
MDGNIKKPKTILYNNKNKSENYLTPGSQMEWGGMRFNPPFQWDVSPNREWFGLMQMMCSMELPKNAAMIEIGTYAGESTSMFACSGMFKQIHTIDPYDFPQGWQVLMEARVNCRYWDYIEFWRNYSFDCHHCFKNGVFDFVYIDGDHTGESVERDIDLFLPKVKKGGYIGGHDYNPECWPEVVNAVNKKFRGKMIQTFDDKSWVTRV